MADSLTLTYRGICIEDLQTASSPTMISLPVLGIGPTNITPFVSAPDDATAQGVGLNPGDIYIQNSANPVRMRAIPQATTVSGGTTTSGTTLLQASALIAVGVIPDGTAVQLATTINLVGAAVGNAVELGVSPALPAGIMAFGKVTAANTITVEIWSLFGSQQTLGQYTFTAVLL